VAAKPSGGSPGALLFSSRPFSSTRPAQQATGDAPVPSAADHKYASRPLSSLLPSYLQYLRWKMGKIINLTVRAYLLRNLSCDFVAIAVLLCCEPPNRASKDHTLLIFHYKLQGLSNSALAGVGKCA
jgi:hypothetical protein